jgi:hypothetical protein
VILARKKFVTIANRLEISLFLAPINLSISFNTIEYFAIPPTLEVAAAAHLDGIVFRRNDVSWRKTDIHAHNGFKKTVF